MNSTSPLKGISEGFLLFMLAAMNFTHIMDFVVMAPLNDFMVKALGISQQQFGLLLASYTLSAALAGFTGFFFVDRYDRRTAILFLYLGFTVSNFACAVAPEFYSFLFARIAAGAFGGVLGALIMSTIGDVVPPERRGRATGIVMAAFSAASVLGIPVGLMLASSRIGWQAPFYLLTAISLAVLVFVFLRFPSITSHIQKVQTQKPLERLKTILGKAHLQWAMLFTALLMLSGFLMVPFLSYYMANNVGIGGDNLWKIYLFGGFASLTGPLVGKLADKYGKAKVYRIAALSSVIPIYGMTVLPVLPLWQALVLSTLFFVFFGARFIPGMALTTGSVELRDRGSFMSINSTVQNLASSLAAIIGGAVVEKNAQGMLENYWVCGLLAVLATLLCVLVSFKVKQIA